MPEIPAALAADLADRYRIERELGAGGMATVYLARDLKHDRPVAIKVLRPELAEAIGSERFVREIATTANLRHPHILPLYDSGQAGGLLFYAMPFIEGESLRTRLTREGQLPLDDALRIAREVADALSYAHARGVIHRDIKPENILLDGGHAVVADFGIARAVDSSRTGQLTALGSAIGTPAYMSPEQAAGEQDVDGRSDLYSLGCVLYEMLAGQPPFTGPTAESLIRQHIAVDAPPVTNLRPAVPPSVVAALQRALAKTPADRFNPVAQFAEVLHDPRASVFSGEAPTASTGTGGTGGTQGAGASESASLGAPIAGGTSGSRPVPQNRRIVFATAGVLVILVALAAIYRTFGGDPGADVSAQPSIAVLPFVDMSPDRNMEYFGDGMAEEILNALAQVPDLKVAGRTSSFSFRDKAADLKTIGEALGVGTVLEGSVRRSGDQMRITAQLIRTSDQSHLWSETFDRGFNEDVFAVQDDIARAIAGALRVQLGGGQARSMDSQRGTNSLEAYNAYLRGRYQWNRRTREGLTGSVAAFQEAIRLDTGFARAYAGLADAYSIMSNFGWLPTHEAFELARPAVERALALDPNLADAHVSLGAVLSWYDWDFEAADQAFKRAIALGPQNTFAHYWYAILLDFMNRKDEARAQLDAAVRIEPLSLQIRNGLGNHYQWHGEHDAAINEYLDILRLDPDFQNARWWLAVAYLESGRVPEGLAALDSVPRTFADDLDALRGWGLAQLGRRDEARAALATVPPSASNSSAAYVARSNMLLGQPDEAFALLRASYERREYSLLAIVFTPAGDPLRADPRFNQLVQDMGLLKFWRQ